MYIRKRLFTVIISFLVFSSIILGGFLFCETRKTARSVAGEGYGYQRDIANLSAALDKISDGLQKAQYAATPYRSAALAADLLAQAESARTALSSLPTYELMLTKTNEFLSRVGDYSMYLTRKAISGGEMTEEERANLRSLSEVAEELASRVSEVEISVIGDNMDRDGIAALFYVPDEYWEKSIETAADGTGEESAAPNSFLALEDLFPTSAFNYDGKFSDHLKTMSSAFLDSKEAVTEAEARERAATILSLSPNDLVLTGDVGTKSMKCYAFSTEDGACTVYMTKQGGYLYSYSLSGRDSGGGELTDSKDNVLSAVGSFLAKCGYSDVERAYWKYQDDTLFLTYVTLNKGVRIYPEEINLAVSLTDGRIVYCDASGYLTQRNESRSHSFEGISKDAAVESVSDLLEVESVSSAVIQSAGGRDLPCYEVYCKTEDGQRLVVYINAENGAEEESLLLTDDEEGYSVR